MSPELKYWLIAIAVNLIVWPIIILWVESDQPKGKDE